MCCGVVCAAVGAAAGVGAFFCAAAAAAGAADAPGASAAAAATAEQWLSAAASAGALPPALTAALLPDVSNAIAAVSGRALLIEHLLFACMGALWLSSWAACAALRLARGAPEAREPLASLQRMQAAGDRIRSLAGPPGVLEWPGVRPAPAPSMDVSGLADGQAAAHADGRGAIYRFKLHGDTLVNMYYTKAGHMRSGDLHEVTQYDVVLKGRVRLTMKDPVTLQEQTHEYRANDFIVIPARWPHLFEFLEDNCLLEWWDGPFQAWYYEPMRRRIEESAVLLHHQRQQQEQQQQQQEQEQEQERQVEAESQNSRGGGVYGSREAALVKAEHHGATL